MVDDLLVFMLRNGAHRGPLRMTTTEIGEMTGMSQQNASRRLRVLEKAGKIERKRSGIVITDHGAAELREVLAQLQNAFGAKLEMRGRIADGLGEGRFYLSKAGYRKQIKEKLGFEPYHGTLNVRLDAGETDKRRRMLQLEPVVIEGFKEGERAFGDLFAYPARADGVECAVVVPMRTHHGQDVIELVAPVSLRGRLKKKTGDIISVRI